MKKMRISYDTIQQELRARIMNQEWCSGEKFPSCRRLSQEYDCSINTVEKALKGLEQAGLIIRQERKSTIVNPSINTKKKGRLIASMVISIENPLWAMAQRGIEDYLHQYDFSMISVSHDWDAGRFERTMNNLLSVAIDGMIIAPLDQNHPARTQTQQLIQKLIDNGVKVVLLDRYLNDISLPYIASDNTSASYKLTKELIQRGHRRIGFVETAHASTIEERLSGFKLACFDSELSEDEFCVVPILTQNEDFTGEFDFFAERMIAFLKEHPLTGLFAANDQIAKALLYTFDKMGLSVPRDISLVTYDVGNIHVPLPCKLTGVNQNFYGMGKLSAEVLLNQVFADTQNATLQTGHVVPANIVIGESIRDFTK